MTDRYILEEALISMLDDYIDSAKEAVAKYAEDWCFYEALRYNDTIIAYEKIKKDILNNAFKIYTNKNTIK